MEYFHHSKNPLCSSYSSLRDPQPLLTTQPLATSDLFTEPLVLPFLESHLVGIAQFVAFGFFHVVVYI